MSPQEKIRDQIERLASKAFAEHVIHSELNQGVYRHFRCAKPGTGIYAFNITTFPGRLVVTGDVGTLVVERLDDMFEWAPSAVESIDYFAEKVSREIETKRYDPDLAFEFLAEQQVAEGTESELARIASELEDYTHDQSLFLSKLHETEILYGCDTPELDNWTPSFLWCREAVRWFFRNYKPESDQ